MMNHFIRNLLTRHIDPDQNVKPRVRGMYESDLDLMSSFHQRAVDEQEVDHRVPESPGPEFVSYKKQPLLSTEEHRNPGEGPLQKSSSPILPTHRPEHLQPLNTHGPEYVAHVPKQTPGSPEDLKGTHKQNFVREDGQGAPRPLRFNAKIYVAGPDHKENQFEKRQDLPGQNFIREVSLRPREDDQESTKVDVPQTPYVPIAISANRHNQKKILPRPVMQSQTNIAPQVINVTIGRVEVRASLPAVEAKAAPSKVGNASMSLDQYLDQKKSANR